MAAEIKIQHTLFSPFILACGFQRLCIDIHHKEEDCPSLKPVPCLLACVSRACFIKFQGKYQVSSGIALFTELSLSADFDEAISPQTLDKLSTHSFGFSRSLKVTVRRHVYTSSLPSALRFERVLCPGSGPPARKTHGGRIPTIPLLIRT